MSVCISKGNNKIGKIPNISHPPGLSCPPGVPCFDDGCYARKAYRLYPNTRKAWDENHNLFITDPTRYFNEISGWLYLNRPKYFRWFTSGDIVNQEYLDGMILVARFMHKTKFMTFTKNHGLDFSNLPSNLSIIISTWPDWDSGINMPMRKWWVKTKNETRIPNDAIECSYSCSDCFRCWDNDTRDIWAMKH